MAKIALCVIATNDYCNFIEPLLVSADYYFLKGHEVDYHLFTNCPDRWGMEREIVHHPIEHQPWPAMTLNRYHIMSGADLSGYDYVYYIDADMRLVAPVGDEILYSYTGVLHPGFYRGGGDWEVNPQSKAYVNCYSLSELRSKYICGGFQGGSSYWNACHNLSYRIDEDSKKGITAVWNDESHWNKLLTEVGFFFKILDPSYCMVEEPEKRKAWGIDHLEPKIIALKKDHSKYQK